MLKILLKFVVSAALIWWLISQSDTERLAENLMTVNPWGMALAVLMLLCLPTVQALRWSLIIREIGSAIRYRDAYLNVLIGIFFNQILPSSIGGDAIRIWRTYRLGLGVVPAVHSVALDRISAMLALILMAGVCMPLAFSRLGDTPERWGIPILVIGGLMAFALLFLFDRIPGNFMNWHPLRALARLSADARRVLLRPASALPVIAISMGMHSVAALAVYVIAQAMGLPVEVLDCLILVPPVVLFSILPISIAGWGVREGAMVTAFAFVGIGYDEAFALSVLFGLVIMATGVPGGIFWLILAAKKPSTELARNP